MFERIPKELKKVKQWVCWSGDKLPKNPHTGGNARSNDKSTWSDFKTALDAVQRYGFNGVGFMFAPPYFGVDLDKCIDNEEFIEEFVRSLNSYTEYSTSGQGIHIICKGKLPQGNRRRNNVEMYDNARYFIMTGNLYDENLTEIVDCSETIKHLHAKYLADNLPKVAPKRIEIVDLDDEEIIRKARECKTGAVFQLLYSGNWCGLHNSQSEADLALCNHLAFWTQCNASQMDRIFRSSGLYRSKWDTRRGEYTYGEKTIERAIASCGQVYQPQAVPDDTSIALAMFKGEVKVDLPKIKYDMTDTGNAQRFRDKFISNVKYSFINKKWYYWTGKVWAVDNTGEIKKLADTIINDIKKEAFCEEDDEQEVKLKWANKTASSKGKESMIKECQHLDGIPVLPSEMDAYSDYLNCNNGIVNLRNGELIPHDSNFLLSNITFGDYDCTSGKKPELWLKFIDDITNHDKDLARYLQKCVGYSLTGSIREQCLFILYGMGNNGKSTFLDIISEVAGLYAGNAQPETFMAKSTFSGGGANSDIARLKGKRLVTIEEATDGIRFNEGLIKQLTGGSKITCRFLYGDEFEYSPEYKLWFATNHKPVIRGTDVGIWRRMRLIPFNVNIPKEKVDKGLKWKLRKELPQILKWAVDGCILWQKEGLEMPTCVASATAEYKQEMDMLASFMDSCLTIDYTATNDIKASDLFLLYSMWARTNNEYEMPSRKFALEMTKKLPDKQRKSDGIYYRFITLNEYGKSLIASGKQFKFTDFTQH